MIATGRRLEVLEREIRTVRRSLRCQRIIIGSMTALFTVLVLGGAGQPAVTGKVIDELRVKRLSIVDSQGRVRIGAATFPDGSAQMSWLDRNGKLRIAVTTLPDGVAAVQWYDSDETLRISASTVQDGDASVTWYDRNKELRIIAAASKEGVTVLPTMDMRGKR